MTADERNRCAELEAEWDAFAFALGWEMRSCSLADGSAWFSDGHTGLLRLTGLQRDDILRAISSAEEEEE